MPDDSPSTSGESNVIPLRKDQVNTPRKARDLGPTEANSSYSGSGETYPTGELKARHALTIVTGDRAREWELRQTAAIRELLVWLNNYAQQDQRNQESA